MLLLERCNKKKNRVHIGHIKKKMTAELEENSSNPLRILFKEEKKICGAVFWFSLLHSVFL